MRGARVDRRTLVELIEEEKAKLSPEALKPNVHGVCRRSW
jgi:hypothetical protein